MDVQKLILNHYGNRQGETIWEYLSRLGSPMYPTDHAFTSSREYPGACGRCGWITPETKCDHCGRFDAKEHVGTFVRMVRSLGFELALAILVAVGFVEPMDVEVSFLPVQPPRDTDFFN